MRRAFAAIALGCLVLSAASARPVITGHGPRAIIAPLDVSAIRPDRPLRYRKAVRARAPEARIVCADHRGCFAAGSLPTSRQTLSPARRLVRRSVAEGTQAMRALVDAAAFAAGVPLAIAHAVIVQESGYRPHLRGAAGEYGIGQVKCQTAREVGFSGPCAALLDPQTNLSASMKYLRRALDRGGSGCAGVTLYNTGIYARPHCSAYGRAVMARAGRM